MVCSTSPASTGLLADSSRNRHSARVKALARGDIVDGGSVLVIRGERRLCESRLEAQL
jgi:hypothetical protein